MKETILWAGIEYKSVEQCIVSSRRALDVASTIIGAYKKKIYRVDYILHGRTDWEIIDCSIKATVNGVHLSRELVQTRPGLWSIDGRYDPTFNGCKYIDISLTPFTNTLPIRTLDLDGMTSKKIKVVYFDVLSGKLKPVYQRYKKLANRSYLFQNVPNDFEATIAVDRNGLVAHYPELFRRISV